MAILERTPPPQQRLRHEDGVDASGARSPAAGAFVFPSLDAMAAPARERNAWQHPTAASSSSVSTAPPKQQSPQKKQQGTGQHPTLGSPHRAPSISPNVTRKRATPSDDGSLRRSPSRPLPSVVDEAFEAQMERALALNENPFMDRRRAAMRDDDNMSSSSSMIMASPPQLSRQLSRPRPSAAAATVPHSNQQSLYPTLPRASSSNVTSSSPQRIVNGTVSPAVAAPPTRQTVPDRTMQDVQRAAAIVRKSLLSSTGPSQPSEEAPAPLPPPPPAHSPPRPRSPPIEVFTPQHKKLRSDPQIIPFAQQEELHKMRAELHDCKARLRQAQLDAERQERVAQTLRDEQAEATKAWTVTVQREKELTMSLDTALKATQYAAAQQAWKRRMTADEEIRQVRIEAVIAKNNASCLAARQVDAEHAAAESSQMREDLTALQEEFARVQDERKQAVQRVKQSERMLADLQEQVDSLQADVARETARRKEVTQREATLRDEVEELQDAAARAAVLRKDVAELKAALRAEKDEVAELRAAKATAARARTLSSSPPAQPQKKTKTGASSRATASSSAPKTSRPPVHLEEDLTRDDEDEHPASPPPARKIAAKSAQRAYEEAPQHTDEMRELVPKAASPKKSRPQPRPAVRKKGASDDINDSEGRPSEARKKPVATASSGKVKKTSVVEERPPPIEVEDDLDDDNDDEAGVSPPPEVPIRRGTKPTEANAPANPAPVVPAAKKKTTVLSKARDASKKTSEGAAVSRRREPSEGATGGDEQPKAVGRPRKVAVPAFKVAAYDETMKTPLLPSRQTRNINLAADDDDDNEEGGEQAEMSSIVVAQKAKKPATAALPSGNIAASTNVEPKKKRRKLLKQGSNPAGDFLTWKGDAEGGLNPQLNLPMELSPLKPGDAGGAGHARLGGGGNSAMTGAHLFGGSRM